MTSPTDLKKLKVTELRDELSKRGLDTKGVKDDLIARLAEAMETEGGGAAAETAEQPVLATDKVGAALGGARSARSGLQPWRCLHGGRPPPP